MKFKEIHKIRNTSWSAEKLVASQVEPCSMELQYTYLWIYVLSLTQQQNLR